MCCWSSACACAVQDVTSLTFLDDLVDLIGHLTSCFQLRLKMPFLKALPVALSHLPLAELSLDTPALSVVPALRFASPDGKAPLCQDEGRGIGLIWVSVRQQSVVLALFGHSTCTNHTNSDAAQGW
jgi:hypothetical protein